MSIKITQFTETCPRLLPLTSTEAVDSTGINNLIHAWGNVTWWADYAFLHMDQTPVPNEL